MDQDEIRRQELSNFLRTRRARVRPADAGLAEGPRRRTPGLRREEVAQLAGVSATWYTWLEQKRPIKVSAAVLESLSRVLKLDETERMQLFQLALRQPLIAASPSRHQISPLIQRLIDQMEGMAAFIIGSRWDVLAWNRAARAFFCDFVSIPAAERNLVWLVFTNPLVRGLMVDWPTRARDVLARFRGDYGRHAGDADFVELVERLKSRSPEFALWWPRHDVHPQSEGRKQYRHASTGRMLAEHFTFSMTDNPELRLTIFAPVAEENSMRKFRRLLEAFEERERAVERKTG
jgi:transcriptional regulator with XRE-family HTH domain